MSGTESANTHSSQHFMYLCFGFVALPSASWQQGHLNWPSVCCSAGSLFPEPYLSHRHILWHCTQTQETAFERFAQLSWAISKTCTFIAQVFQASHLSLLPHIFNSRLLPRKNEHSACEWNDKFIVFFGVQLTGQDNKGLLKMDIFIGLITKTYNQRRGALKPRLAAECCLQNDSGYHSKSICLFH